MGCLLFKDKEDEDIFSKYDFGERIGQGGFGQVLLVTLKKTNEKRAVKIIVRQENQTEMTPQQAQQNTIQVRQGNGYGEGRGMLMLLSS